jgi:hypothetical protein
VTPTRCDAGAERNPLEGLEDTIHGRKFPQKRTSVQQLELRSPAFRQRTTEVRFDFPSKMSFRNAHKPLNDLSLGQRPSKLSEDGHVDPDREPLGVHEDPVTVKDDELEHRLPVVE